MGQKVSPVGLRIGINKDWTSRWVADNKKQMAQWIIEDEKCRNYIETYNKNAKIAAVEIERTQGSIIFMIHSANPALVLGEEGKSVKALTKKLAQIVGRKTKIKVEIETIKQPELVAKLVARRIADAIENRASFRTAQKMAMRDTLKCGAKGIKTQVSGRLGGQDMARTEGYSEGNVPLSTLRSDIDYAHEEAMTTYGIIGVKVWINKGEIFAKKAKK